MLSLLAFLSSVALAAPAPLDLVPLPGSEVQVPLEPDFVVTKRWVGAANEKSQASLMVTKMDVGADKMVVSLTPEALAPQGVTVKSSKPVRIGTYDGTWMEGTQSGLKVWIALVGDTEHTWIFKATAPSKGAGAAVVRMVEGAAWGEPVPPQLAFAIDTPMGLAHAADLVGTRMFTSDGKMGDTAGKTIFVVAPSMQPAPIVEDTARVMFLKVAGLEGVAVEQVTPVKHGAQTGWDVRGKGIDVTTKAPMFVWQRLLFTPDGFYLRLVGVAPIAEASVWLPSWQAAAATLKDPPG